MNDPIAILHWIRANELIEQYGLQIAILTEGFALKRKNGEALGGFATIDALYYFLLGYDWGFSRGKVSQKRKGTTKCKK